MSGRSPRAGDGRRLAAPTALLLLALAVPGTALGQDSGRPPAPGAATDTAPGGAVVRELERRFLQRVAGALELDQEQTTKLGAVLRESRGQTEALLQRRRQLREEMGRLVREEHPDQSRVSRLLDEYTSLQVRQAEMLRDEQRRLSAFLDPVQRARFLYLRQRLLQRALQMRRGARGGGSSGADRGPRRRRSP